MLLNVVEKKQATMQCRVKRKLQIQTNKKPWQLDFFFFYNRFDSSFLNLSAA
jgi:hypothetical protein